MVTQGSPKGAPRAPETSLWSPRPPPNGTQGTILEPRVPLRAPKAHKKAPQELSLVSFWDPGAHFCAQASIFPRCFRKSTIPGLIVVDLRNVTGRLCFFCQRGFPDFVYPPRPSSPMQAETTGGLSTVVPPLRRGNPSPPGAGSPGRSAEASFWTLFRDVVKVCLLQCFVTFL